MQLTVGMAFRMLHVADALLTSMAQGFLQALSEERANCLNELLRILAEEHNPQALIEITQLPDDTPLSETSLEVIEKLQEAMRPIRNVAAELFPPDLQMKGLLLIAPPISEQYMIRDAEQNWLIGAELAKFAPCQIEVTVRVIKS